MRLNGVMLNYRENITANIRLVSKKHVSTHTTFLSSHMHYECDKPKTVQERHTARTDEKTQAKCLL
jgi:hypothetical protein